MLKKSFNIQYIFSDTSEFMLIRPRIICPLKGNIISY